MAAMQYNMRGGRANNPAAAREAIVDLSRSLNGLINSDAPRRIIRPGIAAGLRVLRNAIASATPVNRRRVKKAGRSFAKKLARQVRNLPLHMADAHMANASAPNVRGRLQRSSGYSLKTKRNRVEGKAGLNVGKGPKKTPNAYAPHAHLVTLGTRIRTHKKSGKVVGRMTPNRFVRRAAAAASPAARQAAMVEIKRQIDRHFAKGAQFTRKQGRAIDLLYSL